MLLYAKDNLSSEEKFGVIIEDNDLKFQNIDLCVLSRKSGDGSSCFNSYSFDLYGTCLDV